ncbi:MAG TPA: ATP-dependent DNA ligase [Mycobacteriales bacterium]|nr:ATP-dependent DNA ligase [Mycobacteriales bacterium]
MDLPVMPPVKPMLAKSVPEVPDGPGFLYEPKWDGFRCIVFRDGDEVELGSRNEKPLTRYFPEVVEAVKASLPPRCVVDGEIVIAAGAGLDFEALLQRIHPADSRVRMLAETTPATFIAFDLLALGDTALLDQPQSARRHTLEGLAWNKAVHLTPATEDAAVAREWFSLFEGAGLDGVIAKPLAQPYSPDARTMFKIKHARTADCVVGGFRWHKSGPVVGSLVLGLYDEAGALQHVGVAASFPMAKRAALVEELSSYRLAEGDEHPWLGAAPSERAPTNAAGSRWNRDKDLSFEPLRPELVVEVAYDHMEGARFRHTAQFRHFRPDRDPRSCTYAQLDRPVRFDLATVLATSGVVPDWGR